MRWWTAVWTLCVGACGPRLPEAAGDPEQFVLGAWTAEDGGGLALEDDGTGATNATFYVDDLCDDAEELVPIRWEVVVNAWGFEEFYVEFEDDGFEEAGCDKIRTGYYQTAFVGAGDDYFEIGRWDGGIVVEQRFTRTDEPLTP